MTNEEKTEKEPEEGMSNKKMDKDKMGFGYYYGKKGFVILIGILILLVVLGLGVGIGKMANRRFGTTFRTRNVVLDESGRGSMMGSKFGQRLGQGVTGDVTKIDGSNVTINNGTTDTIVAVQDSTSIVTLNGTVAKLADIKVNNSITVSGTSNSSGTVMATSIRIN